MEAVKFFNWTKEDFTHAWDGIPYTVKAGETMTFQPYLAFHLAKHASIRELNKTNTLTDDQHMPPMIKRFIITTEVKADSEAELDVAILNEKKEDTPKEAKLECCGSKGTRHKKGCAELETKVEAEFEGLTE